MPPKFGLADIASFVRHFEWSFNFMRNPDFKIANIAHRVDAIGAGRGSGRPVTINVTAKTELNGEELKGMVVETINFYDGEISRDLNNGRVYI